jgi:hypothetical protein
VRIFLPVRTLRNVDLIVGFRVTDKSLVQQMINNGASPAEETTTETQF